MQQTSMMQGDGFGGQMMMSAQDQQQIEEGCLQPGTQFQDRNDMMSTTNL
jgi:hypothetical protein